MGEFVQQAQHVARHSGPSGAPHLLCTSKILLSTTTVLAIHIYQPHSEFYNNLLGPCCSCGGERRAPFTDTYIFRGWETSTVHCDAV